jgi:DNA repair exonuclease SbcCD ATPase subunit
MIRSLTIRNWKAFADKHITFSEGITFFVGQNGVGKTTLLDAICLCVTGKSLAADFQELVRDPKQPAEVRLDLDANGNRVSITRRFRQDRKLPSEVVLDGRSRGLGWDELTSTALDFLAVDDIFFNRLTYMSEGEVFRYLQEPPSKALNPRVQDIFGIASLQTLKGFTEGIMRNLSSSIRDISSELKTIRTKKLPDDSQIKALEESLAKLKEKEKKGHEERDVLTKQIREISEEKRNCEDLRVLLTEIAEKYGPEIAKTSRESIDDAIQEAIKALDSEVSSEEENLRKSEVTVGSVQNRINYLSDIETLLQSVIADTTKRAEVPCPVCKRPVDKPLAQRLIHNTEQQIKEAEKELSNIQDASTTLQDKINSLRQKVRKLREYDTRLNIIPKAILERVKPLAIERVGLLLSSLDASLKEKSEAQKSKVLELEAVREEIEQKTRDHAELKAELTQADRLKLLKERLLSCYEGQMLAETLAGAFDSALQEQKDQNLAQVYRWISELWQRFRPESRWKIVLDEKGVIRVASEKREYDFAHLSGGEKTVLLVLARVILCKLLSTKIDFLMIDEPLEHLDIRNRRSLLNFLVSACRKNIIPQMLVTTFEETLIRKYYEGEKTTVELLA